MRTVAGPGASHRLRDDLIGFLQTRFRAAFSIGLPHHSLQLPFERFIERLPRHSLLRW